MPWAWSGRSPKPSKLGIGRYRLGYRWVLPLNLQNSKETCPVFGPLSVMQVSWAAPKFKATYYYYLFIHLFCRLLTCWHVELSILGLFHPSISIHLKFFLGLALGASCVACTTTDKHWCPVSTFSYFHGLSLNRSWNLYPISLWRMERVSLLAPTLSSTLPVIRVLPLGMWATSRTLLKDCREDGSTHRAGVTTGMASTCWVVHLSRMSILPSSNR